MQQVRVGLVGAGHMNNTYARCLLYHNHGGQPVAVAGGSRASDFAREYGIDAEPDVDSLLSRDDLDAVIIATPHQVLAQHTIAAAKKGKHVLVENPMATGKRRNQNTVVVTPTAFGKTLWYNLPVLEDLLRNPEHRALYLFPTKALAQDQLAELRELIAAIGAPIGVQIYDGDTPADQRRKIRLEARITGDS